MHKNTKVSFFNELWIKINNSEKFELIAFLALSIMERKSTWNLTPKSHDGKKDAVGIDRHLKKYIEVKYFQDTNTPLSLKNIGENALQAIYDKVDILWILTNGRIRTDLINFIKRNNLIQKSILKKPTKIIVYNGNQVAILILKANKEDYLKNIQTINIKGYKSPNKTLINRYEEEYRNISLKLTNEIDFLKGTKRDNFYFNPTKINFRKLPLKNRKSVISDYFNIDVEIEKRDITEDDMRVSVTVGSPFKVKLCIHNNFDDTISYKITSQFENLCRIYGDLQLTNKECEDYILPLQSKVIDLECIIEKTPFYYIKFIFDVEGLQIIKTIDSSHIEIHNFFFHTTFIGEKNTPLLALYNQKIEETLFENIPFIGIITGNAGTGKSRLIQEVVSHAKMLKNIDVFKRELVGDNESDILKDILAFLLGFDMNSFNSLSEQIIQRYCIDENFNHLFRDQMEFNEFISQLKLLFDTDIDSVDKRYIQHISQFISILLLKYSKNNPVLLIIEDLHHSYHSLFKFLTELLHNIIKEKSKIILLLSGRNDLQQIKSPFSNFVELSQIVAPYNVLSKTIEDLSTKDALALINQFIESKTLFENTIRNEIIQRTGSNPFSIIHTLLHFKSTGVIRQNSIGKFIWGEIGDIKNIYIHSDIQVLLKERFKLFVKNNKTYPILPIVQSVAIYNGNISCCVLKEIFEDNKIVNDTLKLLISERILTIKFDSIKFEHENIFQFVAKEYLRGNMPIANKIYLNLLSKNKITNHMEITVRALYYSLYINRKQYFHYSYLLFNSFIDKEKWEKMIYYGEQIKNIAQDDDISKFKFLYISKHILSVKRQYSNIDEMIKNISILEKDIYSELNRIKEDIEWADLYISVLLIKADALSGNTFLHKAQIELEKAISFIFRNKIRLFHKKGILIDKLIWAYNRLGVIYSKSGYFNKSEKKLRRSLLISRVRKNTFFIHHNLYDLSINQLKNKDYKKSLKTLEKCKSLIKNKENKVAILRTDVQQGFVFILLKDYKSAEVILSKAIEIAKNNYYYWELNRGLLFLTNLYLKNKEYLSAQRCLETVKLYININNAVRFDIMYYNCVIINCLIKNRDCSNIKSKRNEIALHSTKLITILQKNFSNKPIFNNTTITIQEKLALKNLYLLIQGNLINYKEIEVSLYNRILDSQNINLPNYTDDYKIGINNIHYFLMF